MNLFLAPAAAGNIQKSITNGVRMTLLERYLSGRDLRQLKDVLGRDGPYHCFAMTENKRTTFEGMDLGDEVMLTIRAQKNTTTSARLLTRSKTKNLEGLSGNIRQISRGN